VWTGAGADSQEFTCTYVPTTENDANDANPMSPISVTLNEVQHTHYTSPVIAAQIIGTWQQLVDNGITLGDTGAPAALDPDDHPLHNSDTDREEEQEKEKEKTWSVLKHVGAVLGDGGNTASELDKDIKVLGLIDSI